MNTSAESSLVGDSEYFHVWRGYPQNKPAIETSLSYPLVSQNLSRRCLFDALLYLPSPFVALVSHISDIR